MAITLTLNSRKIDTLLPNGSSYKNFPDVDIPTSKNRIGEWKKLTLGYTSDTNLSGINIYINPGLFLPTGFVNTLTGGSGSYYWSYPLPNPIVNALYTCNLLTNGQDGKNNLVQINVTSALTFEVHIYFYQIYDIETYLNPPFAQESVALLKDKISNGSLLTVSGSSIYTDPTVDGRVYIYAQDSADASNKGWLEITLNGYKAGFYAKDTHEAAPYFTLPIWTLTGTVNGKLNTGSSTNVSFKITSPATVTKVLMWIIRTDLHFPFSVNFLGYYESDFQDIILGGPSGTKISGPYTSPAPLGGGVYESTFKVLPGQIIPGAKYRFIAVVYEKAGPVYETNSFITDEYDVNTAAPYAGVGLSFIGKLDDYNREFTGNQLTCVIEERMRSKLQINYTANAWKNSILARLGLVVPNDIRKYLVQVTFQIYEQYNDPNFGQVRNIFDERIAYKVNATSYTTDGNDIVTPFLTFGVDNATFAAAWRNRYELIDCLRTEINGVVNSTKLANQYWGGTAKYIDWTLLFVYDDYIVPFSDTLVYTQAIGVKDYEADIGGILSIEAQDPDNEDKDFWCPGEEFCLQANLTVLTPTDYNLITNIEVEPGSINTIEESEQWVGAQLPQLTTTKTISQETSFSQTTANKAKWCHNTALLTVNNTYKISAIAKKVIIAP